MSDKINAKEELLHVIEYEQVKVIGAVVQFGDYGDDIDSFSLPLLYTEQDWENFLKFLDRDYDSGYGGQNLFGTVVCEDGIWFDRGEYDGSEWWETHKYPNLAEMFGDKLALKYERYKKLEKLDG